MKTSIVRGFAVSSFAVLALSGCTNKRQELKIKALEAELEALQGDMLETVEANDQEVSRQQEAFEKLGAESSGRINELTEERDRLATETQNLKRQIERAEADRLARIPKDASTPGHVDFDPTKEAKFTQPLATITGDVTTGTGFVVEADGKRYLYTPIATLTGNSRLAAANAAGDKFTKFGNLETAEGCPFVRLELLEAEAVPALQIAAESTPVGSDRKVACLGLAASTGTVTGALGNAYSQTNLLIEVNPELLLGRVGGPVIDSATGQVLGMVINPAKAHTDLWENRAAPGEVQLGVSRLNRALAWQPMPIAAFLAEAKKIADFDRLTRLAQALAVLVPSPNGLGAEVIVGGTHTALTILTEAKEISFATEAATLHQGLVTKTARVSGVDLKKRMASCFASAAAYLQRNADAFQATKFSAYHRKAADDSIGWRKEAEQRLTTAAQTAQATDLRPPPEPSKRGANKLPTR